MERKKPGRKSNSGLKKEFARWRPTTRQVFWAIGVVVTLMTIAPLVVQLYPGLWEDVSREPVAILKGRVATLIGIGVALTVLIVLLAKGSAALGWTGFRGKTLWDLLQLLIVPLVLVGIGFLFEMQQAEREERRARAERNLAEQRAQDESLQAYLDEMGALLLAKDGLRESEEGSEVRTLARARTITVLGRLDPKRKTAVMQFLVEAKLIQAPPQGQGAPLIGLSGANLSEANVSRAKLGVADLGGADLSAAHLYNATLFGAYLSNANLSNAHLSEADLSGADLSGAGLGGADLSYAILSGTREVTKKKLEQQAESLRGASMPDGMIYPGPYASREFEPAVSFEVGEGWYTDEARTVDQVITTDQLFVTGPNGGDLLFTNPLHVFYPANLSEPKEFPAPESAEEWVSWLQSHPNLDTSKPRSVRVEGASGKRIDVTVTSTPENYPKDLCGGQPCVPLYPLSDENRILVYEGYKDRFVIVDVGGETVIIDVGAPADKFDEFLPKAQKVLDTVEWKGG